MTSLSMDKVKVDEGHVACSPHEWANLVLDFLSIPARDPQKNAKILNFGIKDHVFSSGSDLKLEEYLRLRVLWYTWPEQLSFRHYFRNNPALVNDEQQSTPYTGYISPENDRLADTIYNAIKPELDGYLEDIRRVGKQDPTRPSDDCGVFYTARYWQGLVSVICKEVCDENGKEVLFKGRLRKSEAGILRAEDSPRPPRTPIKAEEVLRLLHEGYGTPDMAAARASAGGTQNPATSDESFVNTALLLMLQTITRLMRQWEDEEDARDNSEASSKPPGGVGSQPSSRASSPASEHSRNDQSEDSSSPSSSESASAPASSAEAAPSRVRGFRALDWLSTRLSLNLVDSFSKATPRKKLMEARTDGYLCRRDFVQNLSDEEEQLKPRFNQLPLAILEAKPCTRLAALSATRWQESAEIAAWVSGLDDRYEDVGLLQCSTSGRRRRLLVSQDRHELWIIIAEYGDEWKQYIRGRKMAKSVNFSQSQEVKDLAGSAGFVSLAKETASERFAQMMRRANKTKKEEGSTRASRGPSLDIPGPESFCIMQQWGPFKTENAEHMDFFIRRMIGLHVQLVQTWPTEEFQYPFPE